jgi:hypothetical protein
MRIVDRASPIVDLARVVFLAISRTRSPASHRVPKADKKSRDKNTAKEQDVESKLQ